MLIALGQERKAAELFLKSRTEAQRYLQKSLRVEGSLILYAAKFCRSFFDHIRETAKEFNHDFEARPVNYSALVVWTKSEIGEFVAQLSTQIFQPNVGDQAECVQNAINIAQKSTSMGLEVEFMHQLRRHILESIIALKSSRQLHVKRQWKSGGQ